MLSRKLLYQILILILLCLAPRSTSSVGSQAVRVMTIVMSERGENPED
jgi:hypothetical protein